MIKQQTIVYGRGNGGLYLRTFVKAPNELCNLILDFTNNQQDKTSYKERIA